MTSPIIIEEDLETELINHQQLQGSDEEPEPEHTQEFFKASIVNLVSALGGPDYSKPNSPYVLGADALGCLKDLKRWLRGHDEKLGTIDIAYAISQTTLVTFDLLEILSMWDEKEEQNDRIHGPYYEDIQEVEKKQELDRRQKERKKDFLIALGCLELLVPLTWPVDTAIEDQRVFNLQRSYADYKQAILNHPSNRIMKSVIRLCEPAVSCEYMYTTNKHKDTMKRAFYFFRNIAKINFRDNISNVSGIDRNTLLTVYQNQFVLGFIVSIASEIKESFPELCIPVLECVFYIAKGIDPIDLFDISDKTSVSNDLSSSSGARDLKSLLLQDEGKNQAIRKKSAQYNKYRTSAFYSVQEKNGTAVSETISGKIQVNANKTISLDSILALGKKAKPQKRIRGDIGANYEELFNFTVSLEPDTKEQTAMFAFEFLSTSFNPLIFQICDMFSSEISGLFTAEIPPIPFDTQIHFLYVMAWFLEVNRVCCFNPKIDALLVEQDQKEMHSEMAFVAMALEQKPLSSYDIFLRSNYEIKQWPVVLNCMLVGRELLKTIHVMIKSQNEGLVTMAKKIMTLMFLREERLVVITMLPRVASKTNSSSFVQISVELSYLMIQTFDLFEKRDKLYIDALERSRRSKKKNGKEGAEEEEEEEDIVRPMEIRQKEYSVDKLLKRYMSEDVIDTQILHLSSFQDLSPKQLLNGIKFIHRIFVQGKLHTLYYRLDFIYTLDQMLEYHGFLPNVKSEIKRFESYFRGKLEKALTKTPSLFVELMFPKMTSEVFYYENGISKVQAMSNKQDRRVAGKTAPFFEFVDTEFTQSRENRFKIVVAALCDDEKQDWINWVVNEAKLALAKQNEWFDNNEIPDVVLAPEVHLNLGEDKDSKNIAIALRKNSTFRLLLTICEFELLDNVDKTVCVVPPNETTVRLAESIKFLEKYKSEGVEFPDNKGAYDFITKRQRRQARISRFSGSESEDEEDNGEMDGFIVRGGSDDGVSGNSQDESEEEAEFVEDGERRRHRRHKSHFDKKSSLSSSSDAKERKRKHKHKDGKSKRDHHHHSTASKLFDILPRIYKSSEFVDSSDELEDEEELKKFYEMEEKQRQQFMRINELGTAQVQENGEVEYLQDKYMKEMNLNSEGEGDDGTAFGSANGKKKVTKKTTKRKSIAEAKRKAGDDNDEEGNNDESGFSSNGDIDESEDEKSSAASKKRVQRKKIQPSKRSKISYLSQSDDNSENNSELESNDNNEDSDEPMDFETEPILGAEEFVTDDAVIPVSKKQVQNLVNKSTKRKASLPQQNGNENENDNDDAKEVGKSSRSVKRTRVMESDSE